MKTELLGQIQTKTTTFVIGNSNNSSHVNATLTHLRNGRVRSPPMEVAYSYTVTVIRKGVARLPRGATELSAVCDCGIF